MSPMDFGVDEYAGSGEYDVLPQDSIVPLRVDLERDKENPDPKAVCFIIPTSRIRMSCS